jgi:hypothetical protein
LWRLDHLMQAAQAIRIRLRQLREKARRNGQLFA